MRNDTILISGGTGLVGSDICSYFVNRGDQVICISRRPADKTMLPGVEYIEHDLRDPVELLADQLRAKKVKPSCFIHAARDISESPSDSQAARAAWRDELHLAVVAPCEVVSALCDIGGLRQVVLLSSIYGMNAPRIGIYPSPDDAPPIWYGVAKAGMIHLAKELAVRLAPLGVNVNSMSYGGVSGRASPSLAESYSLMAPQARMLATSDLLAPLDFLLNPQNPSMTGHNLVVDGGWTAW